MSRAELHRWLLVSAAGDGPCVPAPPGPGEKARGQGSGLRKHELELNVAIGSVGNLAEAYLTAAKLANKSWAVYSVSSRKSSFKNNKWDFPGRPVVKIPHFHCRGRGFDPSSGKFHMPCGGAGKKKESLPVTSPSPCTVRWRPESCRGNAQPLRLLCKGPELWASLPTTWLQ